MIISESFIADEGYYISQADTTIYSIEELAYLCRYRGYALDSDFACEALAEWITKQCGCEALGGALMYNLEDKNAYVETILRFVGYVPEREIAEIMRDISEGLSLSGFERKKLNADMLYRQKAYHQAAKAYEEILANLPQAEQGLCAACYYNLAAARAQMFLYEQALDALEASYKLVRTEETLLAWLAVARLQYPEKQYLEIISAREELMSLSLDLEDRMKQIEAGIIATAEGQELEKLREWMQYGGEDGYYVASGRLMRMLCEEYRRYHTN